MSVALWSADNQITSIGLILKYFTQRKSSQQSFLSLVRLFLSWSHNWFWHGSFSSDFSYFKTHPNIPSTLRFVYSKSFTVTRAHIDHHSAMRRKRRSENSEKKVKFSSTSDYDYVCENHHTIDRCHVDAIFNDRWSSPERQQQHKKEKRDIEDDASFHISWLFAH